MSAIGEIREAWELLEELDAHDLRVRELDVAGTAQNRPPHLAVGLDMLGRRHLLVPVDATQKIVEDRSSSGVQILRHALVDRGDQRVYVDVVCAKAHLNELFDVVADEMISEMRAAPEHPDLACRRVLERWRELIEAEAGPGAGPERLAGLFAELWHLRELARLDPVGALAVWVGPQGARHDLMGEGISVEVKATLSRNGRFPEIHSVEQLEPPAGGVLYLAMMQLERVAGGGDTVGQLAREIGDLGVDRTTLWTRMQEAGFEAADLVPDHPMRFAVVENRVYLVDSTFPTITPASFLGGHVPAGVLRVRYLIDLSTDSPAPLDADAAAGVHRTLLGL